MSAKSLAVLEVSRQADGAKPEAIVLERGMNLLVGRPNTGKSSWLRFIDYLLGSTKQDPTEALGEQLASKYASAWADFELGGQRRRVERRWAERGGRTRMLLDDTPIAPDEFSTFLLGELGAPIVRYPRGNPYAERAWATLSWRTLMRHVYRREDQWVDLMPKQPDGEFFACLLEFTGLVEYVYPDALSDLVEKRRAFEQLVAQRDSFVRMLRQVTEQLLGLGLPEGDLSSSAVNAMRSDLAAARAQVEESRQGVALEMVDESADGMARPGSAELAGEMAQVEARLGEVEQTIQRTLDRLRQLNEHEGILRDETIRLRRAQVAGVSLAELKVTHCPVCDQSTDPNETSTCYLCGKPSPHASADGSRQRLDFEAAQVREQLTEAERLSGAVEEELAALQAARNQLVHDRGQMRLSYASIVRAPRQIDDAQLRRLDMELGSLGAKQAQVEGLGQLLSQKEVLSSNIGELQGQIAALENQIEGARGDGDFDAASESLTRAMNDYLGGLNAGDDTRWPFGHEVTVDLRKSGYSFKVGGKSWTSKLGGTMRLYFYLAYHYALFSATSGADGNFPGFLILDFPPDRTAVAMGMNMVSDYESYVLEPFARLLESHPDGQIIATGHKYGGLAGNRVELDRVWS